jgi:hypothetical protein
MKTYVVHILGLPAKISREATIEYWKEYLFNPIKIIAAEMLTSGEQLFIESELAYIGVAVVAASDGAIKVLKEKGYSVNLSEEKSTT